MKPAREIHHPIAVLLALVTSAVAWTSVFGAGGAPTQTNGSSVAIEVGDRKQLFLDHRFIMDAINITLRMNPPAKGGAVMAGKEPWEKGWLAGSATILEDKGKYKMWYVSSSPDQDVDQAPLYFCYAESADGMQWDRPHLGIYEYHGSRANNILLRVNVESACVFIDPKAPFTERYKLLVNLRANQGLPGPEGDGMYIYVSGDGFNWKLHPVRLLPWAPDTSNQAFYDPIRDRYVIYVRLWNPLRKIGRIETDDIMKPWPFDHSALPPAGLSPKLASKYPSTQIPTSFGYDENDPVESDHYTPAAFRYPYADDAYFAFPSAYYHLPPPPKSRFNNDGPLDIQMAVSRDGVTYQRVERAPYIGLGLQGSGDEGSIYMLFGFIRHNDEILQYYHGFNFTHGAYRGYSPETRRNIGTTFVAKQRLDGFVSADAPMEGGSFVTPVIVFQGDRLTLNVNASALGEVKLELRDESGAPIQGFQFADSDPLRQNHLAVMATWNGKSDVSVLAGKRVRIAFQMRAAKLYAFQFVHATSPISTK